ncbi:MAG: biotin/lipoyl-containing protein [Bryobacteraceae bacterium]
MKLAVEILGRSVSLEFKQDGTGVRYGFDGENEREATVVEIQPGVYSVLANGRSYDVRMAGQTVHLCGHAIDVEVRDPREWSASNSSAGGQGRQQIVAPMPGKVVRILVAVGDVVEAGQGLIVVEAMKMQNEMKSPKSGTVLEIKTTEGATVAAGDVLAIIE